MVYALSLRDCLIPSLAVAEEVQKVIKRWISRWDFPRSSG